MMHDPERSAPERTVERILITGYKGFVGPHLAAACAQRYPAARLFGLVHRASQPPLEEQQPELTHMAPTVAAEVEGDITDGTAGDVARSAARADLSSDDGLQCRGPLAGTIAHLHLQ